MLRKRHTYRPGQALRILASAAMACILTVTAVMPAPAATARATTMKLEKTEGTVTLKTQNGSSRKPTNGMRLLNGNTIDTAASSYAHISLDSSKAVKLDQKTSTTVRQSGKDLELLVKSGKLYFNVSSPLTEKENMNIRTSSMVTGIRGTCGVVEYVNPNKSKLYLIEGLVTLGYGENATTIYGGQTATVVLRPKDEAGESGGSGDNGNTAKDMEQKVYVEKLTEASVPIFAITEILSDPVLQQKIEETTELKIKKLEEVLKESQNPEGTEEKKEEEQKQEETTSSGGSYGGSSGGGGSTGDDAAGETEPVYETTLIVNGEMTEADINTALDTNDTVTLATDVENGEISIGPVTIPDNKTLVVGENIFLYADTITVGSGSELVINGNGLLEIRYDGTLTNNGTITNSGTITNNGTITDTESAKGTVLTSGSELVNNDTITGSVTLEDGSKLTNNKDITGNITLTGQSELINNQNCTITGSITLGSGSTLTNSGAITGSGDAVISLEGGKLVLGETDGLSTGSIKNTGETGYTIAVAENPKSTITWNDTSIKIYSSSDLDHAIQGLKKADEFVVPANLEFSPPLGLGWNENLKMLGIEL